MKSDGECCLFVSFSFKCNRGSKPFSWIDKEFFTFVRTIDEIITESNCFVIAYT